MITNPYITQELAQLHIADLMTEAQHYRRALRSRPQPATRPTVRIRHLLRRLLAEHSHSRLGHDRLLA